MSVSVRESSFVVQGAQQISLSQMFSVTAATSNPTYLVLNGLDRNEYTAGAADTTGSLAGNGATDGFGNIGGDGRGVGIVFTYQAASGLYVNSTYGYFNQLVYNSSASANDLTDLSLFGTNNLSVANSAAVNAYSLVNGDASGYLGTVSVATQHGFSGAVPAQATPASIAAVAQTFVGDAWNQEGCWVLASTIAAEAGAALPVQSTATGVAGEASGEWIVAFNGPAGQTGAWQSLVKAGEIIDVGWATSGHVTTCVSGNGSTAMLVDNAAFTNASGRITNLANDGSSNDITIAAAHLASQEFAGVLTNDVVIWELDTPVVTTISSAALAEGGEDALSTLFAATDPGSRTITQYQVYDSAASDSFVVAGATVSAHSATTAATAATLASVELQAGAAAATDTVDVRAFNGSYWGDWQALSVAVAAAAPAASPPTVTAQTANQSWAAGRKITVTLATNTFTDPQHQALTYSAVQSNGQALPSWLSFNAATATFSGTTPAASAVLGLKVTATDTSGLSVAETFSATVSVSPPVLALQIANLSLVAGARFNLAMPIGIFSDPQGQALSFAITQSNGQALPAWCVFSPSNDTLTGTPPVLPQSIGLKMTATDTSGLSTSATFQVAITAAAPKIAYAVPALSWSVGQTVSLALPAGTFVDPQGEKLTYTATQTNGQGLPGWLGFNPSTDTFSGTAPITPVTLGLKVTATDTSGLSASETISANDPAGADRARPPDREPGLDDGSGAAVPVPVEYVQRSAGCGDDVFRGGGERRGHHAVAALQHDDRAVHRDGSDRRIGSGGSPRHGDRRVWHERHREFLGDVRRRRPYRRAGRPSRRRSGARRWRSTPDRERYRAARRSDPVQPRGGTIGRLASPPMSSGSDR